MNAAHPSDKSLRAFHALYQVSANKRSQSVTIVT